MGGWYPISLCRHFEDEDITIYGDGSQTRSFQYVDDLLEGMIRMMQTGDEVTGRSIWGIPWSLPSLNWQKKSLR